MFNVKQKLIKLWNWLRANILNKGMIVYILISELIFWSPVVVCAVLAWTVNSWYWTAVTAIILFWSSPLTPAIPLQLGLALLIKKIHNKIKE